MSKAADWKCDGCSGSAAVTAGWDIGSAPAKTMPGRDRIHAISLILDAGQAERPTLGRYQLEKELGKGAMGVVYLGRDPEMDRIVAIKTMALLRQFDEVELADAKEGFFREAQTAARLDHSNIVRIFDAGEEGDLAYIAMEFLKGGDLVPYTWPNKLLSLERAIGIVERVADALSYAHDRHVVHRDIKPANIMYEPEFGRVTVTDFGLAHINDAGRTRTGMLLGTPSYMSPEQLAGLPLDGRSDLFSLGVAFYQLVCGHLPFVGDSMTQLMFSIANEPHPDIRGVMPGVPECVATIIDRALMKNVELRYQTGAEMACDLHKCLVQAAGAVSGDFTI